MQTTVPLMLDAVHRGELSRFATRRLARPWPQHVFQIAGRGRLAVGYDADFTLVDLQARRTRKHADMASRAGWTPFDGMEITGFPVRTLVRGHPVMTDGELVGDPIGQPVRSSDALPAPGRR